MDGILSVLLTVIVVVIVVRLIVKKYDPVLVFFTAGILLLLSLALITGYTPMGEDTTGNIFLDSFAFVGAQFKSQLGGVGTNLMIVAGYAALMTRIGASQKLATIATVPLKKLNKPYLILAALYVIGVILKMMITSHVGLGLLLMATIYPILMELKISRLSAASAIILAGSLDWGVNDGAVLFAADVVTEIPIGEYFINYQLASAAISILTVALVIAFYYKRQDMKMADDPKLSKYTTSIEVTEEEKEKLEELTSRLPSIYAILPAIPLLLVLGALFIPTIELDVFTANVIGLIITFILEMFITKENRFGTIADHLKLLFKQMGTSFATVVSLIVAAGVFANGLIELGGFNVLANQLARLQGAQFISILALSLLAFSAVIILGSGNAGWFAFGPLVRDIAPQIGLDPVQIAVPMQLSAGMGRGVSPVAAATIAISGLAEVDLEDMIRHNMVPLFAGFAANIISSYVLLVLF